MKPGAELRIPFVWHLGGPSDFAFNFSPLWDIELNGTNSRGELISVSIKTRLPSDPTMRNCPSRSDDKYQPNLSTASSLGRPTSIALQIINNKIYLPVNFGQGIEGKFILDTGASTTIISPDMADLLGIVIENDTIRRTFSVIGGQTMDIPVVCLPGKKVGQAVVTNLSVGVSVIHPDAPVIDGLLGADFLGHFKMTVDHNASRLILTPHEIDRKRGESTKRPSFVWTKTKTPLYTSPSQQRQINRYRGRC